MMVQSRFGHRRHRWQFDSNVAITCARAECPAGHSTGPRGGSSSSSALIVGLTFFRQHADDPRGSLFVRWASRNRARPIETIVNASGVSHNAWTFIFKPPGLCVPKRNTNTWVIIGNGTPFIFLRHGESVNAIAPERDGRRSKALPTVGTPKRRPNSFHSARGGR